MNLQLYFAPGACSLVPHTLLEASGATFEPRMVKLHKGEQDGDEYKALIPRSQVPVLVADGQAITQIIAITQFIAETLPTAQLMPTQPAAKAKFLELLAWMNNSVHPTFTHIFMPNKFTSDEAAQAAIKAHNTVLFAKQLAEIDGYVAKAQSSGGRYLAALFGHDHFSALDAYTITLARWGSIAGIDPTQFKHSWAHVQSVAPEPAVAPVIERERLKLNMMAI